ncbi:MAG TPA: hypothetical protein VMG38_09910 [Trebonia sp.]|nr:hypothetical protein [Trebonia sp.]
MRGALPGRLAVPCRPRARLSLTRVADDISRVLARKSFHDRITQKLAAGTD